MDGDAGFQYHGATNKAFLTHHIFLSENDTKLVEKALFERNEALPEGLEGCASTEYGDAISLYAKLKGAFGEIMKTPDTSRMPNARYEAILKKIEDAIKNETEGFNLGDEFELYEQELIALSSPTSLSPLIVPNNIKTAVERALAGEIPFRTLITDLPKAMRFRKESTI
jgi:hypothetical protein